MSELDARTAHRLAQFQSVTTDCALSAIEIAEAIHICHPSALQYVRHLLGDNPRIGDRIHIERWEEIGPGKRAALYRWGGGKNKRKPKAMTPVEVQRAFRRRAKDRAELASKPNPWYSALLIGVQQGGRP